MKRYKTVYKKVYIQNNVFQFQRNCRNKDRYSPTRRSLIWRPSSTTSPKSEALENAVARSLRFAVPRHQHRVCATHCTGWSREGRRRKGERKAARAGERQTRRGRKDKRDKENEEREREGSRRPMACDLRNVPFFFFPFHSCPFPSYYSPFTPSSSIHWVHACTYASSLLLSFARTCPFFCRISARFFGPRNTEWTMVVVDGDAGGGGQRLPPFHPVYPFFHLSLAPFLSSSKRRKERNAAELQRAQSRG